MLRRVPISLLRPGMFLHAIDRSWLSHPFWRRRFLIRSEGEIAALRDADIDFVTIDTARGLAPDEQSPTPAPAPASAPAAPDADPMTDDGPAGLLAERERATAIVASAKQTMRGVFDNARLGKAVESAEVIAVVDEISGSVHRNSRALIGIVRLKSKDEYTYLHSVAVCALMVNFARHLGLPAATVRDLGLAGLVHDIGKMDVPSEILNKPGRLSDEEFAIARLHPERGVAMLGRMEAIPEAAIDVCHHHHEKIDGTGYPFGLKGDEISLAARMGAICDVYDALTSDRAYKHAWSPAEALTAMASWEGQFDRELFFAFCQSIAAFPTGMLVRLRAQQLAVILPNGRRATRPRLRAFLDTVSGGLIEPRDLTLIDADIDKIVMREECAADWGAYDWPSLREHLMLDREQLDYALIDRLWTGNIPASEEIVPNAVELVARWRPVRQLD